MTSHQLASWRIGMGMTQKQAAETLGTPIGTYLAYPVVADTH